MSIKNYNVKGLSVTLTTQNGTKLLKGLVRDGVAVKLGGADNLNSIKQGNGYALITQNAQVKYEIELTFVAGADDYYYLEKLGLGGIIIETLNVDEGGLNKVTYRTGVVSKLSGSSYGQEANDLTATIEFNEKVINEN